MADYTVYVAYARRLPDRAEFNRWMDCIEYCSNCYLEDASAIGYIEASDGTPWTAVTWNRGPKDRGRKTTNFNPEHLPKVIKTMRLIGL